jgi:hypothetical protein
MQNKLPKPGFPGMKTFAPAEMSTIDYSMHSLRVLISHDFSRFAPYPEMRVHHHWLESSLQHRQSCPRVNFTGDPTHGSQRKIYPGPP